MNHARTFLALGLLAAGCLLAAPRGMIGMAASQADDGVAAVRPGAGDESNSAARLSAVRRAATEKRREWIREKVTAELRDPNQIAALNAQLDALDDQQVDVAAARLLEQLDKRQSHEDLRRAVNEMARASEAREAARRLAAARHAAGSSPAGFFPVITVLPQGASLTASAIVSPDRRHVRISVNPFFSTIGPVDTFNFYTGETRRLPPYNPQLRQQPAPAAPYTGQNTHGVRGRRH